MSVKSFLAADKPLTETRYKYNDILSTIEPDDMLYDGDISFGNDVPPHVSNVFDKLYRGCYIYSIHSGFQLCYEPNDKQKISERFAINALEELNWFKKFVKEKLSEIDFFAIMNTENDAVRNFKTIRIRIIDIDKWTLNEENAFEFIKNDIYQFVDFSQEAIKRSRKKLGME